MMENSGVQLAKMERRGALPPKKNIDSYVGIWSFRVIKGVGVAKYNFDQTMVSFTWIPTNFVQF